MNGYSSYLWPDGRKYEGDYKDDQKHGEGVETYPDGSRYKGAF